MGEDNSIFASFLMVEDVLLRKMLLNDLISVGQATTGTQAGGGERDSIAAMDERCIL